MKSIQICLALMLFGQRVYGGDTARNHPARSYEKDSALLHTGERSRYFRPGPYELDGLEDEQGPLDSRYPSPPTEFAMYGTCSDDDDGPAVPHDVHIRGRTAALPRTVVATKRIPIQQRNPQRVIARIPTTFERSVGDKEMMNPHGIRFSQSSISRKFKDWDGQEGGQLADFIQNVSNDKLKEKVPPIQVYSVQTDEGEDVYLSLDNRRLYCFQQAGKMIPVIHKGGIDELLRDQRGKLTAECANILAKRRKLPIDYGTTVEVRGVRLVPEDRRLSSSVTGCTAAIPPPGASLFDRMKRANRA